MVLVVVRWRRQGGVVYMQGGDTTFNSCTVSGNSAVSTSLRRLCVMFWKDASDLDAFGGCAVATTG